MYSLQHEWGKLFSIQFAIEEEELKGKKTDNTEPIREPAYESI